MGLVKVNTGCFLSWVVGLWYLLSFPGRVIYFILFFIFINVFIYLLFIFGCIGSSLLCAAFSSCGERGLLFVVVRGLLIMVASLVAEHGL